MKKRIFILTSSRADYNPLQNIINTFSKSKKFETFIVVTGQHLDFNSGNTIKEITKNHDLKVIKIKYFIKFQNELNISKVKSIIAYKFSKMLQRYKPSLLILLGDRYELLPCAMSCIQFKIPIAHIHGGEVTRGSLDNIYRNAISKIANIHFVSHNDYRKNLIKLGENPKRIFNFGAPSIENIKFDSVKRKLKKNLVKNKTFLVTYHPNTIYPKETKKEITQLLKALSFFKNFNFILSQPNLDINSHEILKVINKYKKNKNILIRKSLGKSSYFAKLQTVNGMIGNSSSIILESSSFKLPSLNIGSRQKGRILTKNILSCEFKAEEIINNIKRISDKKFIKSINNLKNPFYKKDTSINIYNKISSISLDSIFHEKLL
ncbi:UDP-N-acetylglucosamine 2-epimerase [Pelagibacteraceae bacterium]|nr:UDP-N-acetylglucosamine 2-epimerase [Pelagibacteraceae bacterium]